MSQRSTAKGRSRTGSAWGPPVRPAAPWVSDVLWSRATKGERAEQPVFIVRELVTAPACPYTGVERAVARCLADFLQPSRVGPGFFAWPGIAALARPSGFNEWTVRQALKRVAEGPQAIFSRRRRSSQSGRRSDLYGLGCRPASQPGPDPACATGARESRNRGQTLSQPGPDPAHVELKKEENRRTKESNPPPTPSGGPSQTAEEERALLPPSPSPGSEPEQTEPREGDRTSQVRAHANHVGCSAPEDPAPGWEGRLAQEWHAIWPEAVRVGPTGVRKLVGDAVREIGEAAVVEQMRRESLHGSPVLSVFAVGLVERHHAWAGNRRALALDAAYQAGATYALHGVTEAPLSWLRGQWSARDPAGVGVLRLRGALGRTQQDGTVQPPAWSDDLLDSELWATFEEGRRRETERLHPAKPVFLERP